MQKAPTWKHCTARAMNMMTYAAAALYVRRAFDQVLCVNWYAHCPVSERRYQASKNVTLEMIDDLQEAFRGMILTNDWMDTQTKAAALNKAEGILWNVAYPDFILDNKKLDNYYSGVSAFSVEESDSFSQTWEKLLRWNVEYDFKRLLKPVDRNEFMISPVQSNAAHYYGTNSIRELVFIRIHDQSSSV
ncbi:hypothetical protein ANCCAN_18093 [Ancylostoma caninum]|uniref:Peptidase M13 N-terminal domain-containing protein n=1 Tax=Ancylostoma caninum TaxID=29170 RepID=A0A368FV03_ANCCA|nr:hypothetical protein ANCCAN_18093 [Ancylostoma caninum]